MKDNFDSLPHMPEMQDYLEVAPRTLKQEARDFGLLLLFAGVVIAAVLWYARQA